MLAYITGSVNEDLLRRIEYLLEENRVLRNRLHRRLQLTDHERHTLAEKAIALGKLMANTVTIGQPTNTTTPPLASPTTRLGSMSYR